MPAGVMLALGWIGIVLAVALLAEWLRPYGITQMDLKARLRPPVLFGGKLGASARHRRVGAGTC
jgi:peptide/nickel transport system permease protein